jgi:hypothetical protein
MNYLDHKLESKTALFRTDFDDGYVVWKCLQWRDYRKYRDARGILGSKVDLEIEESVFNSCVIFSSFDDSPPPDLEEDLAPFWQEKSREEQPAGVISTVVKLIMYASGATNGPTILQQLDQHRPNAENIEDQLVVAICRAFPAYTPEQVEAMDWQLLLKRAAQAENILGTRFEIVDHEAEERKRIADQKFNLEKEIREQTKITGTKRLAQERAEAGAERRAEMGKLREEYLRSRGNG